MNHYSFSLEQELALRMVSIQIQKTTDVAKLQDKLIESIEQILIKQQQFKEVFYCPRKEKEELTSVQRTNQALALELEVEATIFAYIDSIRKNHDLENLRALLIEANEICMIQKKYSHLLAQYMSDHQSMI